MATLLHTTFSNMIAPDSPSDNKSSFVQGIACEPMITKLPDV